MKQDNTTTDTSMNEEIVIDEVYSVEELEKRASWFKNRECPKGFNARIKSLTDEMRWADRDALVREFVIHN